MVMASASLMVNYFFLVKFFFLFRLVGIVGPQWHFGSTLANRLAMYHFGGGMIEYPGASRRRIVVGAKTLFLLAKPCQNFRGN